MKQGPTSRRLIAGLVLLAHLGSPLPVLAAAPAPASTPATPTPPAVTGAPARSAAGPLQRRAQSLYAQARYDEAVTALFGPVSRGELKGTELRDARVLMARCYVKKGLTSRAQELFKSVLADEPGFVLEAPAADAEELAVFEQVRAPAPPATAAAGKGKRPKPNIGPTGERSPGWLSRHKLLAGALAVGAGSAAVAVAASGGGGGSKPVTLPVTLPNFPDPPGP